MRILIDLQSAQTDSRFRGIGRYSNSLTKAIIRNGQRHEILLLLSDLFPHTVETVRQDFYGLLPQENIYVWQALGPVAEVSPENRWRQNVAQRIRKAFIASLRPDVVHVTSLFEGFGDEAVTGTEGEDPPIPTAVTLYDLIPYLNPGSYLANNPPYARYYAEKIQQLKSANLWFSISESVTREGCEALGLPGDKVVNLSAACDPVFHTLDIPASERTMFLNRLGISKHFVLYSGGTDPRKNLERLIKAYARLPTSMREQHVLVIAGKVSTDVRAGLMRIALRAGLPAEGLLLTGYVSDIELAWLYNLCSVFIMPSLHEGFGLPILEAMACGAAAIGSNSTSIPEVIGRDDAMFDPTSIPSITQKLQQVLGDEAFRTELSVNGLVQAEKFSWDRSALAAIAAFERLHSESARPAKPVGITSQTDLLVQRITADIPDTVQDAELLVLAHAISRIPGKTPERQLLVDISELTGSPGKGAATSLTEGIVVDLLRNPPPGYVVRTVSQDPTSLGYRYATRLAAPSNQRTTGVDGNPIDFANGDIFLILDAQQYVALRQADYLAHLHRHGVQVYFLIFELVPGNGVQPDTQRPTIVHRAWVEALMGFDGAVCISPEVAAQLSWWQKLIRPQQLRPFAVFPNSHLPVALESPGDPLQADRGTRLIASLADRAVFRLAATQATKDFQGWVSRHADLPFMQSSTCSAGDFLHPRYLEICDLMKHPFVWHRKLWEFVFVIHHLLDSEVVKPNSRGLVFGVGTERLPAVFARMGAKIVATDAPIDLGREKGWADSGQHVSSLKQLHYPEIVSDAVLEQNVTFQACDMTNIQHELNGFDFNWSSCCFEHLGTLEAGIDFVVNAVEKTLRIGGIAVHTTEFNLSSNDTTVESGDTVMYRLRDMERLVELLRSRGHIVKPFVVATDSHYLDYHVDIPPYKDTLHLKLQLQGYTSTSAGIVVQRGR